MSSHRSRRLCALVAASALVLFAHPFVPAAAADTDPGTVPAAADSATPETVSADALPTVQIDGVVWKQVIVGSTVYAGGDFTTARPAGSAPGVNTVPRSNMLAYNIDTGVLEPSFAPSFNGKINDMAVTPDGTKLVVVGNFTQVNGLNRYRVAVFNMPSGTLSSLAPTVDAPILTVGVTNSTMYLGGYFSSVSKNARARVAAVSLGNGAVQPFAVPVDNGQVNSLVVSPDGTQVVLGGNFTTVGGSNSPGYGLYRANAATGAGLQLPVNTQVRNAGANASILRLSSDATSFYGGGYVYGSGGNVEGMFQASWSDGSLVNMEDCHGDTYDIAPIGDVVYSASHHHYCGNSGGFPQTDPWTFWHSTAWTKATQGTNTSDIYGYPDHPGTPRPGLLAWFPDTATGTFTGKGQAVWSVTGNSKYVLYGGEFPKVNGTAQQGLVRYTVRSAAPDKQGPRPTNSTATFTPSVQSYRSGQVKITWPALWDRDDKTLTYQVMRQTSSNVIYQTQQTNFQWTGTSMSYIDKDAAPGTSTRYYVRASDPSGNTYGSGWIDVTVASADALSTYGAAVLDDGASKYWPLNEPAGSPNVLDWAGSDNTTPGTGVTRGTTGAMQNSADAASTFDGTGNGVVAGQEQVAGPNVFSQEVWFKTTSTSGGKIAGFGNSNTGDSSAYDRHIYMDTAGRVYFGVYPGSMKTLNSSAGLNDGQWHQVVASLGSGGMNLYVDGKRVGTRADVTSGQAFNGYWRIGGDNTWSGGKYFAGSIDDYSVYPAVLSAKQVNNHWVASGRTSALPVAPTDALGKAMFTSDPDLYWRLDETAGQGTAADAAYGTNTGTYTGNVTKRQVGVGGGTAIKLGAPAGQLAGGNVTAKNAVTNPSTFSQEVWIKTNTTTGGRIFGFGSSSNGSTSGNYDRHLYMLDNGKVRFGVFNGSAVTIDSTGSLNDNAWHQVVSTIDNSGMKLYVDGKLNSSDPNSTSQNYTGYWKLGGDSTWGGNSSMYFAGLVDEAAVYPRALSLGEVQDHFSAGGGTVANANPTAAFSSSVAGLTASFDGSASTDSDGTVVSYGWDFGDGSAAGSGATPNHVYAASGTYTVTLTATDNRGGTSSVSHVVTVVAPNAKPVAAFTSGTSDLTASFDASGSNDTDGTIASYSWSYGDGTPGDTGQKPTHAYATAGTYTATLTVTDDDGATDVVTHDVKVTAPAPTALASDDFQRQVTSGWGTADKGGAWTLTGAASRFSVTGGQGVMNAPISTSGLTLNADLKGVSSQSSVVSTDFSIDRVADGDFIGLVGRRVDANYYQARLRLQDDGSVRLYLLRNDTALGAFVTVPGLTVAPNTRYSVKVQVTGATPTTISAKVWKSTETEPVAWQKTATDSTAGFQSAGSIGLYAYVPKTATATAPTTVVFDRFLATIS